MENHLLTLMTFIPLAGMVVILFTRSESKDTHRWLSLLATGIPLVMAAYLWFAFDRNTAAMQFVERYPWIPQFQIYYSVGIDGISAPMILLTALLSFLCVIASWNIEKATRAYFALFLLLETGMMGVFSALDFILFFVFWEVMLLPMYFLIGIWGGPRKEYAAIKFFLYTLAGSVLLLLAILAFHFDYIDPATGQHTFDMVKLAAAHARFTGTFWFIAFVGLFIGFAIKVPVFPFHTWLPDAHVEAPTAISVILAGVLLKMGVYGILRINYSMLPEAAVDFSPIMATLGVISIIYGACCSMAQSDLKKLVAYSSVSHMGFCMLGLAANTSAGLSGAAIQMFTHGVIAGMLFLLVGVIYDRAHHRNIDGFGGLANRMPIYAGITSLAFMGSLGLPGLAGFIGEALVFLGAFPVYRWMTVIATTGIVVTAGYFLWSYQRVFMGPLNPKYQDLPEVTTREMVTLVPLGILTVVIGVFPTPLLKMMEKSLEHVRVVVGEIAR